MLPESLGFGAMGKDLALPMFACAVFSVIERYQGVVAPHQPYLFRLDLVWFGSRFEA